MRHTDFYKMAVASLLAGSAIISTPANAGPGMRAVTPSGRPDMIFKDTSATDASAKLANSCMNRGLAVVSNAADSVVCQVPMGTMKAALVQAVIGNVNSTTPQQFIKFTIVSIQHDARVQGSAWVETQMPFGQVRREPVDNDGVYNNLMAFMELSGAGFLAGTTFPNYAYLGIGPTKTVPAILDGKPVAGVLISNIVVGSALAQAGGQPNDILVAVDRKAGKTAADLAKRLSDRPIGETFHLTVLRAGNPVELTLTSVRRPAITKDGEQPVFVSTTSPATGQTVAQAATVTP